MAQSFIEIKCPICNEKTKTYFCSRCSKSFCFDHFTQHRQFLNEQFRLIQYDFNQFKQNLIDIKNNSERHPLMKQIDQWENDSIKKITQKANECRQLLNDYTNKSIKKIEINLNQTNEEFNSNQKEKDFSEIYLNKLRETLKELNNQLNQLENIFIEQKSNSFISEISIRMNSEKKRIFIPNSNFDQTWKQNATTIAGGRGKGNALNQLYYPWGTFIDDDQTIYIAECRNHRIVEWKKNSQNGKIVAGGNGQGNRNDQLNFPTNVIIDQKNDSLIICDRDNGRIVRWPRQNGQTGEILISNIDCADLMMDNDGFLYVSDTEKHEVKRWKIGETNGTIVAGGNGQGDRLDQLNNPFYIFVDEDHSIYVSDSQNHRVMKWLKDAKEGIVVAGGQGEGNGLRQLSSPHGMIVDQSGNIYVVDCGNERVMRWLKEASEGTIVVGGNGRGEEVNQLSRPSDLLFDQENNLYVLDMGNHRVQKFEFVKDGIDSKFVKRKKQ